MLYFITRSQNDVLVSPDRPAIIRPALVAWVVTIWLSPTSGEGCMALNLYALWTVRAVRDYVHTEHADGSKPYAIGGENGSTKP